MPRETFEEGMTFAYFYLEHAVTKAQIVQICEELTRAFPADAWAPQARVDGFLAVSNTQYMRLVSNNNGSPWRWPYVSSNTLEAWAADEAIAVPSGSCYHMKFFGLSATKVRAIKRVLNQYGFVFHRGRNIGAWREIRLRWRHREEALRCSYAEPL
jgi:hypothetical protein